MGGTARAYEANAPRCSTFTPGELGDRFELAGRGVGVDAERAVEKCGEDPYVERDRVAPRVAGRSGDVGGHRLHVVVHEVGEPFDAGASSR